MKSETNDFLETVSRLTGTEVKSLGDVVSLISKLINNGNHTKQLQVLANLTEQMVGSPDAEQTLPLRPIPKGYHIYKGKQNPRLFLPGGMIWHPGKGAWYIPAYKGAEGGVWAVWGMSNDYIIVPD